MLNVNIAEWNFMPSRLISEWVLGSTVAEIASTKVSKRGWRLIVTHARQKFIGQRLNWKNPKAKNTFVANHVKQNGEIHTSAEKNIRIGKPAEG